MPGAYPGMPGSEAAKPKTMSGLAEEAFRKGRDLQAFQYLCAAALVNEEATERLPDDFRWVPSLKRPVLGVRWGIGVSYSPAKGYTGHPSPLGYSAPVASNSTNPMGGAAMPNTGQAVQPKRNKIFGQRQQNQNYGGGASATTTAPKERPPVSHAPADPAEFLEHYTGEVGEKVLEALSKRASDGRYGDVLQRAAETFEAPLPSTNVAGAMPGAPPMMAMAMNPMGTASANDKPVDFKPGSVIPGVVVLGEGSERELVETAEQQQVDFIILFEVAVRKTGKDPNNNTKFRVISLEKAKLPPAATSDEEENAREIFVSNMINSNRTEAARDKNEADPVEAEIEEFTAAIDADVKTIPWQDRVKDAATALKRANFLAAQEAENPLLNLAEVRCYHAAKLLDDEQAEAIYSKILGPDKTKRMLRGKTEIDRAAALSKWLPKS